MLPGFPILTTQRLKLRQLLDSDAQEIYLLRSDPMVNKYLDRKPAETLEQASEFIRKVNENFKNDAGIYWAITINDEHKLIGTICLFDFLSEVGSCEVGYELLPDHQGKGIMKEALKKVIEFAFLNLELECIYAFAHGDNKASTNLLQILNFEEMPPGEKDVPNSRCFRLLNSA